MTNLLDKESSALMVEDANLRFYFSKVYNDEGLLIKTKTKTVYFTDARYFYALAQTLKNTDVTVKPFNSLEDVKVCLAELGVKDVYVDFDTVTLSRYKEYQTLAVNILDASLQLKKLRSVKTPYEQEQISKASQIALACFEYILPFIKKGVTELSIKNRMSRFMKKQGADGDAFETIVAFGANSAVPHHQTGKTRLKENQAVLMDFGCVVNGYRSDITRTVFYGEPSAKFLHVYDLVKNAHQIAKDNITENTKCSEADAFARDYFSKHGEAEYFKHSLGHGVGLEIHEYPTLTRRLDGVLKNDTVFTIEPGLYYDGEFGVRIEDTVVLKDGKVISLMPSSKELVIIKD